MIRKAIFILLFAFIGHCLTRSVSAQDLQVLKRGVVRIVNPSNKSQGTGFIIHITADRSQLFILTASHVVTDVEYPEIYYFNRSGSVKGKILNREDDEAKGLALIVVSTNVRSSSDLISLELAESAGVQGGEAGYVIGFPNGTSIPTITPASIARREGRNIVFSGGVNPGNSGGPLILAGKVIGLVTDVTSLAYATPAESVIQYISGILPDFAAPATLAGSTWEATVYHEDCKDAMDQARCRKPRKFLYTFHTSGKFTNTEVDIYECAPNCEDEGYWQQSGDSISVNLPGVMSDGADKGDITIDAFLRGGQMEGQGRFKSEYLPVRWRFTAVRSRPREVTVALNLVGTKWVGKQDDCVNFASIRSERPLFVNANWPGQDNSALYAELCRFELSFLRGGRFVYRDLKEGMTESGTWRQAGDTLTASYNDKDGDTFTFEGTNNGIKLTGKLTIKYRATNSNGSRTARQPTTAKWTAVR